MTEAAILPALERWEALAYRWELDASERATLLGIDPSGGATEVASYCGPSTQERLELLAALDDTLTSFFDDDAGTRAWLRRKNRGLGGRLPLEVMAASPEWIRWLVGVMATAS